METSKFVKTLEGIDTFYNELDDPALLKEILRVCKQALEFETSERALKKILRLKPHPLGNKLTALPNNLSKLKISQEGRNQNERNQKNAALLSINNFIQEFNDLDLILDIEQAISLTILEPKEVANSLKRISDYEKDLKEVRSSSSELLGSLNDASFVGAYTNYQETWKKNEDVALTDFWKISISCAVFIVVALIIIFGISTQVDLKTIAVTIIVLSITGGSTFVISVYSSRYKHARFLRTYYHHLSISTLFYKNYIQDTSIGSNESATKELARVKILDLASRFPENKFDDSLNEDSTLSQLRDIIKKGK